MTPVVGAIGQSYTPTSSGTFAVTISNNGCSDTSECYTVSVPCILENNFTMYPNPTDGDFSIDLGQSCPTITISLTDVSGKLVLSRTYNDAKLLNLELEDAAAGVYMLTLESGDKKSTVRLLKE